MGYISSFLGNHSGSMARERLKGVVLSDRLNCTPETAEKMNQDIIEILTKYLELELATVKIQIDISKEITQGVKNVKTIQIKKL